MEGLNGFPKVTNAEKTGLHIEKINIMFSFSISANEKDLSATTG